MRIGICDDEKVIGEQLKGYLESYYQSLDVLIECHRSGEVLLERYNKTAYDILFLDIEMVGIDGIEVARQIRLVNKEVVIIFLTSHQELATEGYEVNAYRFLIKPLDIKKLKQTLDLLKLEQAKDKKWIIKEMGQIQVIKQKDIIYIEAQNNMLFICTRNGNIEIRQTLNEAEDALDKTLFYRVHRSYLINLNAVKLFDMKQVIMENNKTISISRMRSKRFRDCMLEYVKIYGR